MKSTLKISSDGSKIWSLPDGKYHREDGPAFEDAHGIKAWYKNGKLHREDGPACEYANGNKSWYKNGNLHREDGPAVEYTNERKAWYLNDQQVKCSSNEEFLRIIKLKAFW